MRMVTKILRAVGLTANKPATQCVGYFHRDPIRAQVLEVRGSDGRLEYWISVEVRDDQWRYSTLGILRGAHPKQQMDVLHRAIEYVKKFQPEPKLVPTPPEPIYPL